MKYFSFTSFITVIFVLLGTIAQKAEASLLVASGRSGEILEYDEDTGDFIDTFIPQGSGGLEIPLTIEIGPDNNLYVADLGSNSVLRFNLDTGEFIDTFITSGSGGLSSIESFKFDPNNQFFYVGGFEGDGIRRYDAMTGEFIDIVIDEVPSTGNELNTADLVFSEDGDLVFGSLFPSAGILKQDLDTNTTTTFVSPNDSPPVPSGVTFGPDGNLYVANFSPSSSVNRYDGLTGEFIDTFVTPGSGGLSGAARLKFEGEFLYVSSSDIDSSSVLRYDANTGDFVDAFIPSGSGGLTSPAGLVFTPDTVSDETVNEPTSIFGILFISICLCVHSVKKNSSVAEKFNR